MNNSTTTSVNITTTDDIPTVTWKRVITGIVLYGIVLLTIFGNSLVLVAVAKTKRLQTVFNFYVINLAITDILVAVCGMSFYTTNTVLGYWPFGSFLCGVWIFFDYGMTFASVFTLIVISIDRFWSVTWSVHYRAHHNKSKCIRLIIAVWVFMIVLWLPPCVLDRVNNAVPGQCIWEPSNNKEFVIVIATIGHHGSFAILLICYIRVFYVLRKRNNLNLVGPLQKVQDQPSTSRVVNGISNKIDESQSKDSIEESAVAKGTVANKKIEIKKSPTSLSPPNRNGIHLDPISIITIPSTSQIKPDAAMVNNDDVKKQRQQLKSDRRNDRHERRVFITLTYILIGYIISWLPFHIVFDVSAIAPDKVSTNVFVITFWMSYCNSTINPFLYNFSSTDFRNAFRELLCRK
ncbi:muscarinic acetylcholine receptor M5-like [Mizuhopecten yessoensis]|uniref:Alpha-2A adrenergic receptor n=1 Tax=Mizuhopecten yessoensis TaxID=6573 RepID=A0A210QWT2_MIZYE|nr:muscarinic acetylcholine receptor M5-like [Mizuhopecten yessoensis]OWF53220.1 Alpha-2A adrenergic receptor [Mizuhopecten yessoensis]